MRGFPCLNPFLRRSSTASRRYRASIRNSWQFWRTSESGFPCTIAKENRWFLVTCFLSIRDVPIDTTLLSDCTARLSTASNSRSSPTIDVTASTAAVKLCAVFPPGSSKMDSSISTASNADSSNRNPFCSKKVRTNRSFTPTFSASVSNLSRSFCFISVVMSSNFCRDATSGMPICTSNWLSLDWPASRHSCSFVEVYGEK
mmetsp:Transcript_14560/g.37158  ORF Transcript_14560/g.37158 Transcript_14560/m.37158 type:complete len:201 (-) Transcript_14560:1082-1684(-)